MERLELIRRLVLNSISDDFENVDQIILPDVVSESAKFGLSIVRSDIVSTLEGLIADGLAKAYILSGAPDADPDPFTGELPGMPPLDTVEEDFKTDFYITRQGLDFHCADDSWRPPNDEDATPE